MMTLVAKHKSPNTIHHKKRVGAHHRHSKDYTRPYQPYLPLLVIIGLGLLLNTFWAHQGRSVLGFSTDVSATTLLADTNATRAGNHETALQLNDRLTQAAQAKANDMAARNYWSHDAPDGKTPWTFITTTGYSYQAAGENLAYGFDSSSALLSGWMHSTEHRDNILNQTFSDVGFGIANAPSYQGEGPETIVVAMYAEPAGTVASAPATPSSGSGAGITSPSPASVQPAAQRVARIQVLHPASAAWSLFAVSALGAVAIIWFVTRHVLAWKRVIVHSEEFIIHHRLLDVAIVSVAVLGFILTRTAGVTH
jgi:Cysteine-rich secretory protein family